MLGTILLQRVAAKDSERQVLVAVFLDLRRGLLPEPKPILQQSLTSGQGHPAY